MRIWSPRHLPSLFLSPLEKELPGVASMAQESWKLEQDETGCQHPEGPILCRNKCGFFGSAATMNLCSKCYRDIVLKQPSGFPGKVPAESSLVSELGGKSLISAVLGDKITASSLHGDLSIPAADPTQRPDQPQPPVTALDSSLNPDLGPGCSSSEVVPIIQDNQQSAPRAPNRCFACRRRVGLTGFKCRCGDVFCASHRYSDKHDCIFDYKAAGRDAIAKANPVVKAEKIEKI